MTILPRTEADYVKTPEVTYSVSLTEKEIRRVGERRYGSSRWKLQAGIILGPSTLLLIWGFSEHNPSHTVELVWSWLILLTLIEGLSAIAYFLIKTNREGKKFFKEISKETK